MKWTPFLLLVLFAGCGQQKDPGEDGSSARCIDLNGDSTEVVRFSAVGPREAAAIVAYRGWHGPFVDPLEVAAVEGIDEAQAQRILGEACL